MSQGDPRLFLGNPTSSLVLVYDADSLSEVPQRKADVYLLRVRRLIDSGCRFASFLSDVALDDDATV